MSGLSRRRLLSDGALVVAFALARPAAAQEAGKLPGDLAKEPMLDAWIRIDADGRITVYTGKAELGQGLKTALRQIAADELAVPAAGIELITADTDLTPDEGITSGSHSMQDSGTAILNAAANVRTLLCEAAAWRFVTAVDQVYLRDGAAHGPRGETLGFGELAAAFSLHVEARAGLPRRFDDSRLDKSERSIGRSLPRVDIPAKLMGGAAYVQDMRLPGMLHARIVRGPSEGTVLKDIEVDAVAKMPGIAKVVRLGRFTAVLAEQEWHAVTAMQRLQATAWERPVSLPAGDIRDVLRRLPAQDNEIFNYPGPPAPAGATVVKASYSRPCLMHGSIGPPAHSPCGRMAQ